ncbi:site-specific recombinase XerD [Thermus oshimai JL-2]|uniref:Site-specific recombinase XerD n=1 Tax=Thermus oshimai JL-2 TaxID=751945 RepID=K7RK08_THEOS|nr:tyrosine-type recombinase/integrase [Thermus oshimai]AFV76722.1 site-specific recombinase XerD [Thermus oshimai JL-2]
MSRRKGISLRKHPKRGLWEARVYTGWSHPKPKQKSFYGRTKAEAREKAEAFLAQLVLGRVPEPEEITVREWALRWLEERRKRGLAPNTLRNYRKDLALVIPSLEAPSHPDPFGDLLLQEVKPVHVQTALVGVMERASSRALKACRARLQALFQEAEDLELIVKNPVRGVKLPTPREEGPKRNAPPSPEELRAFLAHFEAYPPPTGPLLLLLVTTGLRKGEALGLKWEDVDLEAGVLWIRRQWTYGGEDGRSQGYLAPTKSRRERKVPLPKRTLEALHRYREELGPLARPDGWVFPSLEGDRPLNPHTPNWALRRIAKRLGVRPPTPHSLRHAYASLMAAHGVPIEVVGRLLGHASPVVTQAIYRHVLEEEITRVPDVGEALEALEERPQA